MTTIAVLADPPVEGCVPTLLPDSFAPEKQVALYRAVLADVCDTIQRGGADLLVNYRQPAAVPDGVEPESALRSLLEEELADPGTVRYEVQVGESYAGRVGNTLTHLLETEEKRTVAVAEPTALFLRREHIGTMAMQLRSNDVVLGPAPDGRVYFAAFGEPIDFTDVFASPAIETLAERCTDAGLGVSFLPMTPVLEGPADLQSVVSLLRARIYAGGLVPKRTATLVADWDLSVSDGTVQSNSS